MPATVCAIAIAPVKGLGLVHPSSVELTTAGVAGDRRYALLDGNGKLANGKRFGPLVQVRPLDSRDGYLSLGLPDGTELDGDVALGEEDVVRLERAVDRYLLSNHIAVANL